MKRWGVIAAFALVGLANQAVWLTYAPITTGAAHHLGVSEGGIGLLSEVFPLLYLLLALPTGWALDRWFRPTLLLGAAGTALGALLRAVQPHSFSWILIGQLVAAVAQPAILNAITGLSTRALEQKDRPAGIAIGSAGTFLGLILAFSLGLGLGAGRLGAIQWVVALVAVVSALLLLVALIGLEPSAAEGKVANPESRIGGRAELALVWADPVNRWMSLVVFFGFGVFVAINTWAEALLKPEGISARSTDAMLIVMVAVGVLGCVLLPPMVAARRLQVRVLPILAVVSALAEVALASIGGRAVGFIGLAVIGAALMPALPIILDLVESRSGHLAGMATGLVWMTGNAGGVVIALLVQVAVPHRATSFLVCAIVSLGVLPVIFALRRALATSAANPLPSSAR